MFADFPCVDGSASGDEARNNEVLRGTFDDGVWSSICGVAEQGHRSAEQRTPSKQLLRCNFDLFIYEESG